jgi:hypothetical protein
MCIRRLNEAKIFISGHFNSYLPLTLQKNISKSQIVHHLRKQFEHERKRACSLLQAIGRVYMAQNFT